MNGVDFPASGYIIGVDVGGTFTDCVVLDPTGQIVIGKAPSTPPTFQDGFVDAVSAAARDLGLGAAELLCRAGAVLHGCTVGTNALVERRTPPVGLLTTAGHGDTLSFMQAGHRLAELDAREIARLAGHTKPAPLVPKQLIREVDERVAADGAVVVEMDDTAARRQVRELLGAGVETFAIALLWSTVNAKHERRLGELVVQEAPGAFVSLSSEVVARRGEYPRTVATVINAMIGPITSNYLKELESRLTELGYRGQLSIMSCTGGLIDVRAARERPLLTIGSGPVAGVIGAGRLARTSAVTEQAERPDVLTADMGGTTFDVGIIRRGRPVTRMTTRYGQYEYFVPTLDVRSVGAGGGSIVGYDNQTGSLRVGPRSAGAVPGPAAYCRGGVEATITDADLVLGLLNPSTFLGGQLELSVPAAREALERAGAPLGFSAEQTAAGAAHILDAHMADAIRMSSIQQGYDPRGCVMYCYGGAGALHCPAVARALGITTVVMPLGDLAAGWSAFGVASADAVVVRDAAVLLSSPFNPNDLEDLWSQLERNVEAELSPEVRRAGPTYQRFVEMRYAMQVNQLTVPAPAGPCSAAALDELVAAFEQEYEQLYGRGSGYPLAGYVITSLRVAARARTTDFQLRPGVDAPAYRAEPMDERSVIWYDSGPHPVPTPVYSGAKLTAGAAVDGPAVVEFADTVLALRDRQRAVMDRWNSLILSI
ncbi:hydantoinase/oxoprolinase family protein [Mycobacterium branderi]|uniref:5-oxoprolinase n=1 Tax=Mycobacterium branderi TaxID=43348 RepID=A0A7I7WDN8_9MYCO|nr:hydantoinase/oxoprolinase family protein [Mycobacterium branderi]MCV7231713.1 hydantoinase/oxoprolinase family protein [Mycobacterium branderi]ORA40316.1 hypothetical protein BST20_07140 [Mycobacterium branderi]BBZ15636.1 5-oxoprolinase [Mycobacterium branderi]